MSEETQVAQGLPRRQALCGIVALGVLGPAALAACSSNEPVGQQAPPAPTTGGASPPAAGGGAVAKLSEIPQGGGKVVTAPDGRPVVIVRGNDGSVKAFSATCTHQGVTVNAPANGVIVCPQHNSKFNAADGSVAGPPATKPLPEVKVTVAGDDITIA